MEDFMFDKIEIEYELCYDDLKVVERRLILGVVLGWSFFTLLITITFVLGVLFGSQKITLFAIVAEGIYVLFLFVFISALYSNPHKTWRQQKDLPKDRTVKILPDCIEMESSFIHYECSWNWVMYVREFKKVYIIYSNYSLVIIIPKRTLSDEQENEFRNLVKLKVRPEGIKFKNKKES